MIKSKLRKLLTKPKFRAWLEGYRPRQVVGLAGCNIGCPIAKFLNMDLDNLAQWPQWPRWMQDFIVLVDSGRQSRITASRALKILDGIK